MEPWAREYIYAMREQRRTLQKRAKRLFRDRNGSRSGESAGELGGDRQVGVESDPLKSTDSERE